MAAARMAATDWSTSASLVDQFDTEMRMAAIPCQVVPLSHSVPPAWTADDLAGAAVVVAARVRKRTSTWLSTTSLRTSTSLAALRAAAKWRARRLQQRSTSSATPERPSERSAAQTANPGPPRELGV